MIQAEGKMKKTDRYIGLFLFGFLFCIQGCFLYEDDLPKDYGLSVEAVDIACTDAVFKVTALDSMLDWTCGLFRDDSLVLVDTLVGSGYVWDEGMEPNTSYAYSVAYLSSYDPADGSYTVKDESGEISFTTMETTSVEYDWQIFEFGDYNSQFNDVQIINENDIWVVGNITTDSTEYNSMHWDGNSWEYICNYIRCSIDLNGITHFSDSLIWVIVETAYPAKWNGSSWRVYSLYDMGLNMSSGLGSWAINENDLWFCGYDGAILNIKDGEFLKYQPTKEGDLLEIKASPNGEWVFSAGHSGPGALIQIHNGEAKIIEETVLGQTNIPNGKFGTVIAFSVTDTRLITKPTAIDMAMYNHESGLYKYIPKYATIVSTAVYNAGYRMCGDEMNDLYFISIYGHVIHYNGKDFKRVDGRFEVIENKDFLVRNATYDGHTLALCGMSKSSRKAVIIIGEKK